MSETEHKIGKLIPVEMSGTYEETCKKVLHQAGIKQEDYYNSFSEQMEDEGYRKYVTIDEKLYRVDMEEIEEEDDIFRMTKNKDGTIDFEIRFYNGGCSFNDAIEEAIKEM